jgi:Family of unknown function (DUF5681)
VSSNDRPDHLWKPGQSGNPSGRAKVDLNLRRLARERTVEALETLAKIMLNEKAAAAARVAAAQAILDRGWGKPVQPTAFTDLDGNDRPLGELGDLTDLEKARRIAYLLTVGLRVLPAKQSPLEQTKNQDRDLQRPSESPSDSNTYRESSDDSEETL